LQVATIAKDGLLVVRRKQNLAPCRECIIIPRQVLSGLLMALHIKLDHPSTHQLRSIVGRYFYALDIDKNIESITKSCYQCASLQNVPKARIEQSSTDPPEGIGISFAADVLRRERQLILIVRECVSSFTVAQIIETEKKDSLRDALVRMCLELRPLDGPFAVIRTDAAPGFVALVENVVLAKHRLCIEVGRIKNLNKNPIAERAVQEVESEILHQDPTGGAITAVQLSTTIARLNSRIRNRGLSAREIWTQRDQFTLEQLPISDRQLILDQHLLRTKNHPYSEHAKAPNSNTRPRFNICIGDLVYLYTDKSKSRGRSRYLVVSVEDGWCNIRKFAGSQLRSMSYRVKQSECYKVPSDVVPINHRYPEASEGDEYPPEIVPPQLPNIPVEISVPEPGVDIQPVHMPAVETPQEIHPNLAMSDSLNPEAHPPSSQIDNERNYHDPNEPQNIACDDRPTRVRKPPKYLQDYDCS
jgi:hypothetical protein